MTTAESVRMKYCRAGVEELQEMLPIDVGPKGNYAFDGDAVIFVIDGLPAFQFHLSAIYGARTERELFVWGRGEYAGFMLLVSGPKTQWCCSAEQGDELVPTTRSALKLADFLCSHHGVGRIQGLRDT